MIGFSMGLWNSTDSVPLFDYKKNNATMSQQFQILIEKQIMAHCQNSSKVP
jgi:hypothetical protein